MAELFQIPKRRLQKPIIIRGNTCLDVMSDFISIQIRAGDIKAKHRDCVAPSSETLSAANAMKGMNAARQALKNVLKVDQVRNSELESNIEILDRRKKELMEDIEKIEANYFQNLKFRENDRLDTLSKIDAYVESTREFKREREKQDILIRIGLIMEALLDQLAPYEEMLGRLSLQENAFKSKADTLGIKKDILMGRKAEQNSQLKKNLFQSEETKIQLFRKSFMLRETTHYKMNLINRLVEMDTKTMRAVLDLESKLNTLRNRATQVGMENSWLYWFLDWVLFDVIGKEMLTGISHSSSPSVKTQYIIDTYKNIKRMLAKRNQDSAEGLAVVDLILN